MINRDKQILHDLERFRVLDRDLIAALHFSHTKNPITHTNSVMKRLRRDKYVTASTERRKYLYFPADKHIKKDSQKINHFLEIANFYKEIRKIDEPKAFIVEPKYGKGMMEPDIFMIFRNAPVFVEIQRTRYTEKQIKDKLLKYQAYYVSGAWEKESWQPENKKVLPHIWILSTDGYKYEIPMTPFRVFQNTIEEMAEITKK